LSEMRLPQKKLRGIAREVQDYGACHWGWNACILATRYRYMRNDELQPAAIGNQATFGSPIGRELCRANYCGRWKRIPKEESRDR
jgi:hypothetical protein